MVGVNTAWSAGSCDIPTNCKIHERHNISPYRITIVRSHLHDQSYTPPNVKMISISCYSGKHDTPIQIWFNIGPPWTNSQPTLGQRIVFGVIAGGMYQPKLTRCRCNVEPRWPNITAALRQRLVFMRIKTEVIILVIIIQVRSARCKNHTLPPDTHQKQSIDTKQVV